MFTMLFLCIAGFFAALVDAIAGGGGVISVPAFLFVGISSYYTLGTNKFASSCGSLTSTLSYFKSGKVQFNFVKYLLPFSALGAILGVNIVLIIDRKYLNIIVLTLLIFVGLYSLFSKNMSEVDNFKGLTKSNLIKGIILAFAIGFYDGFFGPGTGSFLVFGLVSIFHFDFIKASGNAKALNFTSNVVSLILFALKGQIVYKFAIPVALFMILGSYVGSKVALKKGSKLIKPIFITMSLAMAVKLLYEVIH